jgi:hypothetical protein
MDQAKPKHRLPLGVLAMRNHVARGSAILRALHLQGRLAAAVGLNVELGEILTRRGELDRSLRGALLALQDRIDAHGFTLPPARPAGDREIRPFGEVAQYNGVVRPLQVRSARLIQEILLERGVHRPLGEVLVREKAITPAERDALLALQSAQARHAGRNPENTAPGRILQPRDLFLGVIAIQQGALTRAELESALATQRACRTDGEYRRLGEILCEQGGLTRADLDGLLEVQAETVWAFHRRPAPLLPTWLPAPRHALGRLLLGRGVLTARQLGEGLEAQRVSTRMGVRMRLGEVLSRRAQLSPAQLSAALDEQWLRGGQREAGGWLRRACLALAGACRL